VFTRVIEVCSEYADHELTKPTDIHLLREDRQFPYRIYPIKQLNGNHFTL